MYVCLWWLWESLQVGVNRCLCFFFFVKQKRAYEIRKRDWSSDVCSSDLNDRFGVNVSSDTPVWTSRPARDGVIFRLLAGLCVPIASWPTIGRANSITTAD